MRFEGLMKKYVEKEQNALPMGGEKKLTAYREAGKLMRFLKA